MTASTDLVTARRLPPGRYLAVTWGIPDRYGGMTAALLRRSRAFVREGGREVEVVTFDPRLDVPTTEAALRRRGELTDGVQLRNIYDHLRRQRDPATTVAIEPTASPRPPDERRDGDAGLRVWTDAGRPFRLEHRRADGSLAVLDERRREGGPRRLITTFDAEEASTGQWTEAWDFYADWLDSILGDDSTYAIVDSKTIAPFVQSYRRPNVTTVHVVHGSHLREGDAPRLSPVRRPVLHNLPDWDAVALLTHRQRDDIIDLVGDSGNLAVVPNAIDARANTASDDRDVHRGVIVANLTTRKRIDHALEIIGAARAAGAPVTADIVGDGPERTALEALARRLDLEGAVRFVGYRSDAARSYEDASWTLITSTSEGAPLALLEAMARGCVPIAYDIRYGPADTVVDRENGFLVADGSTDAAASALVALCAMSDAEQSALRANARDTALRHSTADVVARWAEVLVEARRQHEHHLAARLKLTRVRVRRIRGRLRVSATVAGSRRGSRVQAHLLTGDDRPPVRTPLRRLGRYAVGRVGREQTAALSRRSIETRIIVATPDVIALDAGHQRVDPRPLRTRAAQRIRRMLGRTP